MPSLRLAVLTLLLPLITIAMLWRRPRRPLFGWLATFFAAAGITGFSVLAAPWGWFGIPVRWAVVVLFVAAAADSLRRRPEPEAAAGESPLRVVVKVLLGFFFGGVAVGVLRGHAVPPQAVDLRFPLRGGSYLVGHGGSTSASNMHHLHPLQRYAVDFMKLGPFGMRARGLYPDDLRRYAIYGSEVVSPCAGIVTGTVNALPDLPPGQADSRNLAGNHVVVRCGDVSVTLAHLQRGSVAVPPGARVAAGQLLGRVGNSGNTSEPHLHVHAERNGTPVPATFDGEWLVRNEIVRR